MKESIFDHIPPKLRQRIIVLGLLGLLLLLLGSLVASVSAPRQVASAATLAAPKSNPLPSDRLLAFQTQMNEDLARILGRIKGAGEVSVAVTLAQSPKLNPAMSSQTTVQTSTTGPGQSSKTQTTDLTSISQGSNQEPLIASEDAPKVTGVLVVASGAADPNVRAELTQAVQTVLGLPAFQVMVAPRQRVQP